MTMTYYKAVFNKYNLADDNGFCLSPAKVMYLGNTKKKCRHFTLFQIYNAYFISYTEDDIKCIHVLNEKNNIVVLPFELFAVLSDKDRLLSKQYAVVRTVYIEKQYKGILSFGKKYKAIGVDDFGFYLIVKDFCVYRCLPYCFETENDRDNVLVNDSWHSFTEEVSEASEK